jgi:hypothetical protein
MTAVEKTPNISDSPFAPEAEDEEDEPMQVEQKEEVKVGDVGTSIKVQEAPQWTNDELYRLMDSCEFPRTW